MPSQEDYLDSLLKDLSGKEEQKENAFDEEETEAFPEAPPAFDIDEVSNLSEDEIMDLLSASGVMPEDTSAIAEEAQDVLELLKDTEDDDLQAIQELLERADNHERIEEELPEFDPFEYQSIPLEDDLMSERGDSEWAENEESAERKVAEKKAAKKAKAAEAKAAKEAKAAERKAAKEAKAAERKAAKEAKAAEKKAAKERKATAEETSAEEDLFDTFVLDSIVSGADNMETFGAEDLEPDAEPIAFDFGTENLAEEVREAAEAEAIQEASDDENVDLADFGFGVEDETPQTKAEDDFDLSSLFGDSVGEDVLGMSEDGADLPDFASLDEEDTDAVLRKVSEQADGGEKKKGFFARILDFFTEEDEEDEKGNEDIQLSEENQEILKDLDKEKEKKGKKKKKKGKDAEGEAEAKPEKTKKEKKEKKPKKPKKEKLSGDIGVEPLVPPKKLSLKRVFPVVLVGLSVGVLLIVFVNASTDYMDKREAREAFYENDYKTCYQNLFGKELNESEKIMYGKSESILYIRLWLREYEMFAAEGEELKALDSLIQTVDQYPVLYEYALQWNAGGEVAAGYAEILGILSEKYGLTEEQAQAIADEPKDIEYTRMVLAVVQGKGFGGWNEPEKPVTEEKLEDELPEESELGDTIFINNQ